MEDSSISVEPWAVLAHELRNPIGAIRNAVALMECAGQLPGAMEQARRLIARQVSQLSVLVEDLLDFASFTRGTLSLRREWIDVVPEVEAAVESCNWAIVGCGHTLRVDIPDASLYAYIDGPRLRQIIVNLLDNACKYSPAFGQIRVTLERVEDFAVCVVQDNGVGIAAEQIPYVFDLFTRYDSNVVSSPRGLGIGLALVREIVELHGGDVQARSGGVGCGSAFIVRLPTGSTSLLLQRS